MKVPDVLLGAMARGTRWWEASESVAVGARAMRGWRQRWGEYGYPGLADRRKGRPSGRWAALKEVEKVLELHQETYHDLNIRHTHAKLQEKHGIELSYTWAQQPLQGADLPARRGKRCAHRRGRERRPLSGMLCS